MVEHLFYKKRALLSAGEVLVDLRKNGCWGHIHPLFCRQGAATKSNQHLGVDVSAMAPGLHLGQPAWQVRARVTAQVQLALRSSLLQGGNRRVIPRQARSFTLDSQLLGPCGAFSTNDGRRVCDPGHGLRQVFGVALHVAPNRQQSLQQGVGGCGDLAVHPLRCCRGQRVKPAPPMVLHGLALQGRHVFQAGLLKQALAVECVFTQHAQAPAVDGVDGRLVHPLRGML